MIPVSVIGDFRLCIPEIIVSTGSLLLLLTGVFSSKRNSFHLIVLPIIILSIALISFLISPFEGIGFFGSYISDTLSYFVKIIIFASSIALFIMMFSCVHLNPFSSFEFPIVILISILGMLLLISSNDMISFYMAFELQSLAIYIAIAMNRESMASIEASLKYFILGAFSSCFLLYGMSFIYGFTGYTDFSNIAASLFVGGNSFVLIIGIVFIIVGLFFKIALVPFHMWMPDVYEGSSTFVTAFIATIPKFTVSMALIRIYSTFWPIVSDLVQIFMIVSVLSMIWGSIAAIGQQKLKRIMAYSSISHAGYALVGLSTGTIIGISATIRYMVIYLVVVLGLFACILSLRRKNGGAIKNITDFAGLSQSDPFLACIITILVFSLAGIPPFAGFFGKYFLLLSAIKDGWYLLAIVGLLSSVISVYYYLRIISVIWFDEANEKLIITGGWLKLLYSIVGLFVVSYFLFENSLIFLIDMTVLSLF